MNGNVISDLTYIIKEQSPVRTGNLKMNGVYNQILSPSHALLKIGQPVDYAVYICGFTTWQRKNLKRVVTKRIYSKIN